MDQKLMQRFLPYAAIAMIITILSLLFLRSRRSGRKTWSSNESEVEAKVSSELPSSSSSLARKVGFEYDVFLSFRGPDTRKTFTDLLYETLTDKGVKTFIDNENLEKGQKVEELLECIQRSKIFVPIFSSGYADSDWCLKEIAKMVECNRLIVPVFIDVEPRDVRHQTGPFESAFRRHRRNKKIDEEEVNKWSEALRKAGEVAGFTLATTNGYQGKFIQLIAKRILGEVNKTPRFIVAEHPVGLESRIAEVKEVLDVETQTDVRIVGIHGMGGIGKTTLSKAVYNEISSRFDACSFLSNVREAAKQVLKLVPLQEQLLHDAFNDQNVYIRNTHDGIAKIKERIGTKKVLLVLDDVDNESQLNELVGDLDWFHKGSRIIVTTRDKQVLGAPRVNQNHVYELKKLDTTQALELFCWHAFGKDEPNAKFADLSNEVASTAAGLPLALKLFGSHFFDLKTVEQWRKMLRRLKKDLHKDIHERLKISFDVLDEIEKKVFLDIACFFIGRKREERERATLMWEDCEFYPDMTIKVLMHKSLVSMNTVTGQFEMHDHIRDMGRKIVQSKEVERYSRLWKYDEAIDALHNKKGIKDVEAIKLFGERKERFSLDIELIAAMSQLRMLQLPAHVTLKGEYEHFPRNVRWLKWSPQDLNSLPSSLHLENITILDLSRSSMVDVWDPQKVFPQLKVLDLGYCKRIILCPNLTSVPYLEMLNFTGCEKMSALHPSIGLLKKLTHLNLGDCISLKELPESIYELTSLEKLNLWGCKITTLPPQLRYSKSSQQQVLGNLKFLHLSSCSNLITCPDFTKMPNLETLSFYGCRKMKELHLSIGCLKRLISLDLRSCESLKELPQEVWQLTSLQKLDLKNCSQIIVLPSQIGDSMSAKQPLLEKLKSLDLLNCTDLFMCPDLTSMPHLEMLRLHNCGKIRELDPSIGYLESLIKLDLTYCRSLKKLPQEIGQMTSLKELYLSYCSQISTLPESMGHLKQLNSLYIGSCSSLQEVPKSIVLLDQLKTLSISNCELLKFLPPLPPSLILLDAKNCYRLESIADISKVKGLQILNLMDCVMLVDIPGIEQLKCLEYLYLGGCSSLPDSLVERIKDLDKLKELELHNCDSLIKSPHFISNMTHLLRLSFSGWVKMTELDPSICHLKVLNHLNLSNCRSLKELPEEVSQLTSLKWLILTGCCQIKALPKSICLLLNLETLNASHCESLAALPNSLGKLKSLGKVDLSWTAMEQLPNSIISLEKLRTLSVGFCNCVKFLPPLPPSVTSLIVTSCKMLLDIPGIEQLKQLKELKLGGCRSLQDSFFESLKEANFEHLDEFSITGIVINGGSPYPHSITFIIPKQFYTGFLYLYVDESSLASICWELEKGNGISTPPAQSVASEDEVRTDSQVGRSAVRVDIITDDAQFTFSTFFNSWEASGEVPTATFERDSEMMRLAREGRFKGNSGDAQGRKTTMMMRVSIHGCVILNGDLSDGFTFDPLEVSQNIAVVKFENWYD